MALARRSFIVGGAHTPYIGKGHPDFIWKRHPDFGTRENPDLEQTLQAAVDGALADTGVDPAQVDRLYLGNFCGELFNNQGHLGAALVGTNPAFAGKPIEKVLLHGGLLGSWVWKLKHHFSVFKVVAWSVGIPATTFPLGL